jgi:hypothetical protein
VRKKASGPLRLPGADSHRPIAESLSIKLLDCAVLTMLTLVK